MKRKILKKYCVRGLVVFIPVLVMIGIVLLICRVSPGIPAGQEDKNSPGQQQEGIKSYLTDTVYDGSTVIDREVFQIQFQKSNQYVRNKDYIGQLKDDQIKSIMEVSEQYLETLFGNGFRDILADTEGFVQKTANFYSGDYLILGEEEVSARQQAEDLAAWYTDCHVKMEAKVTTDKSLIFKDGYPYIRNVLNLTLYSCSDPEYLQQMTDIEIQTGDRINLVCDVGVVDSGKNEYSVISMDVVGSY